MKDRCWTGTSLTAVVVAVMLALLWIAAAAEAKPPRWTERQAEQALLSRADTKPERQTDGHPHEDSV